MAEMVKEARKAAELHGQAAHQSEEMQHQLADVVGKGALKYFILKVDPKKKMLFDPAASIDLNGNTGPFIQYAYARIQSIMHRSQAFEVENSDVVNAFSIDSAHISEKEIGLIKILNEYPLIIQTAGLQYSPAIIANYIYDLVKHYNSFYQSYPIFDDSQPVHTQFRVLISGEVGKVIKSGMGLLGVSVPDHM